MSRPTKSYINDFFEKAEREGEAILILSDTDDFIELTSAFQAEAIVRNATNPTQRFVASSNKNRIRVVCQRKNDQPIKRLEQPILDAILVPPTTDPLTNSPNQE